MTKINFYIFAYGAHGEGISGGDRIFIEIAKRIQSKFTVSLYLSDEGKKMCNSNGLKDSPDVQFIVSNLSKYRKYSFFIFYLVLIISSLKKVLAIKLDDGKYRNVIYSASEFWMDSLPAFILKLRYPQTAWISAWYQTAPSPFKGFGKGRYRLNSIPYWLVQLTVKPLINRFSDIICVNNEGEKVIFPKHKKLNKIFVMYGAVPLDEIRNFLSTNYHLLTTKKYDAVFQGRFHPQKGVVELIDIWRKVVDKKPDALLAMIGDGPLMEDVVSRIAYYYLQDNVKLFGYVFDGPKKYKIFSQSKIVVHPAYYDSGGMASAEAMAFGIPCVGFDLPAYKSYYPKGMVTIEAGDIEKFAERIISLLNNYKKRNELGKVAQRSIEENYSWDKRAEEFINKIEKEL